MIKVERYTLEGKQMELGENIRKYRKERKLTQTDIAYTFDVTTQSVSRWENGLSYPDISMLPIIADFLKFPLMNCLEEIESVPRRKGKRFLNRPES